jgi:hypothetical protein
MLLFWVSIYALVHLNTFNRINSRTLSSHVPVLKATEKLIDLVIYQEQFARRYLILRDDDIFELFRDKQSEIHAVIKTIQAIQSADRELIGRFKKLLDEYAVLLTNDLPRSAEIGKAARDDVPLRIEKKQEEMVKNLKSIAFEARSHLEKNIELSSEKGLTVFRTAEDFLGHIGGDDFVIITTPQRSERRK